jgi:hypothetical protein
MFDYRCNNIGCEKTAVDEEQVCPSCGSPGAVRCLTGGVTFTTIKATTNTSKRYKAGYVHKYQNRPAEKISVSVPRGG